MTRATRILVLTLAISLGAVVSSAWACQNCDSNGYCFNSESGWTQCRMTDFCELGGDQCGNGGGGICPGCRHDDCGGPCLGRPTTDALVRVVLLKLPGDGMTRLFPAGSTQRNVPGTEGEASVSAIVNRIANLSGVSPDALTLAYFEMDLGRVWFSTQGRFANGSALAFRAAPTGSGLEAIGYQRTAGSGFSRVLSGSASDGELLIARTELNGESYVLALSSMRGNTRDEDDNIGIKEEEFVSSARYYPNHQRLHWSVESLDEAQFASLTSGAPGATQTTWGSLKAIYH